MRRTFHCTALLALSAATLAACGSSSSPSSHGSGAAASGAEAAKPARQILDDAAAAIGRAHSFAITGRLTLEHRPSRVLVETEGSNQRMQIEHGKEAVSVTLVAGSAYIKASSRFYTEHAGSSIPPAVATLLGSRWIQVPPSEATEATKILGHLSAAGLARCLASEPGTFVSDGTATVAGTPAVVIENKGDTPGATPAKFYVAASGEPFLLRAVATGAPRPGGPNRASGCEESGEPNETGSELAFSRYNSHLGITAPAGAVSASELAAQFAHG